MRTNSRSEGRTTKQQELRGHSKTQAGSVTGVSHYGLLDTHTT